jgi:hypothetical protein
MALECHQLTASQIWFSSKMESAKQLAGFNASISTRATGQQNLATVATRYTGAEALANACG